MWFEAREVDLKTARQEASTRWHLLSLCTLKPSDYFTRVLYWVHCSHIKKLIALIMVSTTVNEGWRLKTPNWPFLKCGLSHDEYSYMDELSSQKLEIDVTWNSLKTTPACPGWWWLRCENSWCFFFWWKAGILIDRGSCLLFFPLWLWLPGDQLQSSGNKTKPFLRDLPSHN